MLTEEIYHLDKKENSPVPLKIKGAVRQDRQLELNGVGGKIS